MPCMQKVSSKERRAAVLQSINGLSNLCQPGINSTSCPQSGLNRVTFVRSSEGSSSEAILVALGVEMESRPLADLLRVALPRSRLAPPAFPASPRPTPLCLNPPRPAWPGPAVPCPARGISGFWIRHAINKIIASWPALHPHLVSGLSARVWAILYCRGWYAGAMRSPVVCNNYKKYSYAAH